MSLNFIEAGTIARWPMPCSCSGAGSPSVPAVIGPSLARQSSSTPASTEQHPNSDNNQRRVRAASRYRTHLLPNPRFITFRPRIPAARQQSDRAARIPASVAFRRKLNPHSHSPTNRATHHDLAPPRLTISYFLAPALRSVTLLVTTSISPQYPRPPHPSIDKLSHNDLRCR